jgi:hypothetical protein
VGLHIVVRVVQVVLHAVTIAVLSLAHFLVWERMILVLIQLTAPMFFIVMFADRVNRNTHRAQLGGL